MREFDPFLAALGEYCAWGGDNSSPVSIFTLIPVAPEHTKRYEPGTRIWRQ